MSPLWEEGFGLLAPPGGDAAEEITLEALIDDLLALVEEQDRRIAELEYRLFQLERARASPYREVEYRVYNGQILMRSRYGKNELRIPRW